MTTTEMPAASGSAVVEETSDSDIAPLRVGIVGFGKIGQLRANCLAAHPDFEVRAICDIDPDRAARTPGAAFHQDYKDLLAEDLDVVFVCAFNHVAPEVVTSALDRGCHVFCEKPPGCCVEDVEKIQAAEQRNPGLKLKFGFNHRYHYSVIEAKSMVEGGRFGKVLWVRGVYGKCGGIQFENEWRNQSEIAGGGILLDQGIHMLDLCRYFCGDFNEVQSLVTTAFWNIPVEDNAFAILRTSEGQVALVHSSATQWKHRFLLEICLEGGYINLDGILSSTRSYGDEKLTFAKKQFEDEAFALGKPREETIFFGRDDSWSLEIEDFAEAIRQDRPVASGNSTDALRVMQLIEEIYRRGQS
ncbi:MAG: Gfo/Idh/MocA family oxidoreductase [Acidobacteriota bacterium]